MMLGGKGLLGFGFERLSGMLTFSLSEVIPLYVILLPNLVRVSVVGTTAPSFRRSSSICA
jgi:hypothetical protein